MSVPDLTTRLGPKLTLLAPVLAASGTLGWGDEVADLTEYASLGAFITPTITLLPRQGCPMPRTVEVSAGLLHSLGMPNPGLTEFLNSKLPVLSRIGCPVFASVCGSSVSEWRELAERISSSGVVSALELNFGQTDLNNRQFFCPPSEVETLELMEETIKAVCRFGLPIIAKLPSYGADIGRAAALAERAGANVIAVSQGFPGIAVRTGSRKFRLPGVVGTVSGPCIKPLALYQVWQAAKASSLPIIGSGGIYTVEDAVEFLAAGAAAAAVGVANLIHPNTILQINADLASYMTLHGIERMDSLTCAAIDRS